jgi:hypothetical protein
MTALGKLLVLFNLAFSLLLAAWAFGVYSNRIDFSDKKATADQTAGEFQKRDEELKDLYPRVAPAEYAWRTARADIQAQEARRLDDRAWYLAELAHVRTKATPADPVRIVVYADQDDPKLGVRKGQVALDPTTQRPRMAPAVRDGKGVPSLAAFDAEEKRTLDSLEAVQNKFEAQVKEATALTERMIGPKGLIQRLIDERQKRDDVVAEQKLVKPLLINGVVDGELIVKRHRALQKRVDELKGTGVAARER